MKKMTKWALASALVLVAGCTATEASDTAGGTTSTGMAGSSGASGAGGTSGAGMSGSGGSSSTEAGATEISACEKCAYAKCKMEVTKCAGDPGSDTGWGCVEKVGDFYECLKTADTDDKVMGCEATFVSQVFGMGMGRAFATALARCVDDTDPAKGCRAECGAMAGGGSDAGHD